MKRSARPTVGKAIATLVAIALVGGLGACASVDEVSEESGTWTVLSFSIADTDLEPYMMDDVGEMGDVGGSEVLSVVALVDRADGYSDAPVVGIDDWVGGKLLELSDGAARSLKTWGTLTPKTRPCWPPSSLGESGTIRRITTR